MIRIVDNGTTLRAYDGDTYIGGASRECIGGSRGQSWYWDIEVGRARSDARRKPEAKAELLRLATIESGVPQIPDAPHPALE